MSTCIKKKMSGEGKLVCVTGASGCIASWVVKLLLLRGYSVNATVRNLSDPNKVEHLMALEGAKERLQLISAELSEEGSFDSAINGCVAVFHMASPCLIFSHNPQAELSDPAVKGTINVLSSCTKVSSIKRVVLTSSIASMLFNGTPTTLHTIVDETWFSDPNFCRKQQKWYALSKIQAEEAAWEYAKHKGIDLVTICPGCVIGPLLQPSVNTSSSAVFDLIGCVPGEAYTPLCKFSRKRAESLGIEFIPIEEPLKEMIESFREKQFITI